ncbi:MAG: hypothetical protein L0Y79_11650 [Chlorobi bacterium]|nr:hypothetical protein [Chlorobiota bacterium]MCI0716261.1 hypothetical protein [Chlorobiota bacterium]
MEPPISYPESDSYKGQTVYGKKRGCAGLGCFGIVGAIIVIVIIVIIGYFFAIPALMPNKISGDFLDAVIVPSKDGSQKLWILTDGSFNFIKTTKSPGRTSTGRECYFCKTWTYIIDPETENVEKKIKTPYEDIITQIDLVYHSGKVWEFTREYGENEPRIEAFDSETGEKVMDTKEFMRKFPVLAAGLAGSYYDEKDNTVKLKTKDGRDNLIYSLEDGKLYNDFKDFREAMMRDSSKFVISVLSSESSSGPRKKLYKIAGPKSKILDNKSSLESYAGNQKSLQFFTGGLSSEPMTDRVFLEGIIYHQDSDCAIVIHLDQLGKKSNRIMTSVDVKTGKEKWTLEQDKLFDDMKIDEEDDAFSSLFFTKDNIEVKRSGNLVVLQLKGEGIMGIDYSTGKKLWEIDI